MIMKVFNKGQVVIPVAIRRLLDIDVGDMLDFRIDEKRKVAELRKTETFEAKTLAGSLSDYGMRKTFPSRQSMNESLQKGLGDET